MSMMLDGLLFENEKVGKNMKTFKLLLGSCAVYGLVACASAASGIAEHVGDTPRVEDTGASSSTSSSGGMQAVVQAITNPVPMTLADSYKSGTRLKIRYFAGSDGSKVFAGITDATRNESCTMGVKASDGLLRCLPSYTLAASTFVDSSCTRVGVLLDASSPAIGYRGVVVAGAAKLYPRDATASSAAYYMIGTTCTAFTIPVGSTAWGFSATETDPAAFLETPAMVEQ